MLRMRHMHDPMQDILNIYFVGAVVLTSLFTPFRCQSRSYYHYTSTFT